MNAVILSKQVSSFGKLG